MEFDGETVEFNIYDAMKYPIEDHSLCTIDVIEPIMQDVFDISGCDELQSIIENNIDEFHTEYDLPTNMQVVLAQMDAKGKLLIDPLGIGPTLLTPSEKLFPSIVQAP